MEVYGFQYTPLFYWQLGEERQIQAIRKSIFAKVKTTRRFYFPPISVTLPAHYALDAIYTRRKCKSQEKSTEMQFFGFFSWNWQELLGIINRIAILHSSLQTLATNVTYNFCIAPHHKSIDITNLSEHLESIFYMLEF